MDKWMDGMGVYGGGGWVLDEGNNNRDRGDQKKGS